MFFQTKQEQKEINKCENKNNISIFNQQEKQSCPVVIDSEQMMNGAKPKCMFQNLERENYEGIGQQYYEISEIEVKLDKLEENLKNPAFKISEGQQIQLAQWYSHLEGLIQTEQDEENDIGLAMDLYFRTQDIIEKSVHKKGNNVRDQQQQGYKIEVQKAPINIDLEEEIYEKVVETEKQKNVNNNTLQIKTDFFQQQLESKKSPQRLKSPKLNSPKPDFKSFSPFSPNNRPVNLNSNNNNKMQQSSPMLKSFLPTANQFSEDDSSNSQKLLQKNVSFKYISKQQQQQQQELQKPKRQMMENQIFKMNQHLLDIQKQSTAEFMSNLENLKFKNKDIQKKNISDAPQILDDEYQIKKKILIEHNDDDNNNENDMDFKSIYSQNQNNIPTNSSTQLTQKTIQQLSQQQQQKQQLQNNKTNIFSNINSEINNIFQARDNNNSSSNGDSDSFFSKRNSKLQNQQQQLQNDTTQMEIEEKQKNQLQQQQNKNSIFGTLETVSNSPPDISLFIHNTNNTHINNNKFNFNGSDNSNSNSNNNNKNNTKIQLKKQQLLKHQRSTVDEFNNNNNNLQQQQQQQQQQSNISINFDTLVNNNTNNDDINYNEDDDLENPDVFNNFVKEEQNKQQITDLQTQLVNQQKKVADLNFELAQYRIYDYQKLQAQNVELKQKISKQKSDFSKKLETEIQKCKKEAEITHNQNLESSKKDKFTCRFCMDKDVNTLLYPCGHMLCNDCLHKYQIVQNLNKKCKKLTHKDCQVCKAKVKSSTNMYF